MSTTTFSSSEFESGHFPSIAVYGDSSIEESSDLNQTVTRNKNLNPIWQNARRSMACKGYHTGSAALASTLQGSIWCGFNQNDMNMTMNGEFNRNIVVKVTNKDLHFQKITVLDGKSIRIQESIISEMKILKYLTHHGMCFGLNRFMVNYIDFFCDETNYYLVMENGGTSLFDFVLKAHECVAAGKLDPFEWQNVCKNIFKQMVTFLDILHNAMAVCHLDISLENVLINDVLITVDSADNDKIHFLPQFNIKFCDFGLSEIFHRKSNPHFLCNKWVGKIGYQSPEIYGKKQYFNAKAADIWSLGVCLFALLIGSMPYNKPSMSDPTFQWIMAGDILQLINKWGKLSCITSSLQSIEILLRIFVKENQRISARELLAHPWFH